MYRILLVEDSPDRVSSFKSRFREALWPFNMCVTADSNEAISLLQKETFHVILLDHDLTEAHYGGDYSQEDTGYEVAKFLAQNPQIARRNGHIYVHTLNEHGRARIHGLLLSCSVPHTPAPFLWAEYQFRENFLYSLAKVEEFNEKEDL